MRTIAHISDIHFGRVNPTVAEAVKNYLVDLNPEVLVVSGDFTQRARPSQFRAARAFLDTLPGHLIAVPGNHDVPLYNVFARFLFPLRNYKRYITTDLSPVYCDEEVAVVGINTARSLTWKGGRISRLQVGQVRDLLCGIDEKVIKIVVTHHPFELQEGHTERDLVGRARMAMGKLSECGTDVLLAGHLHHAYTGGTAKRYKIQGHAALVVQAGTAMSTRLRGSANSFNVLRVDPPRLTVDILSWNDAEGRFDLIESKNYERRPDIGFARLDQA